MLTGTEPELADSIQFLVITILKINSIIVFPYCLRASISTFPVGLLVTILKTFRLYSFLPTRLVSSSIFRIGLIELTLLDKAPDCEAYFSLSVLILLGSECSLRISFLNKLGLLLAVSLPQGA